MNSALGLTPRVFLLLGLVLAETASGQCLVGWRGGMGLPDVDGTIQAMTAWDDGSGEALYAGGSFRIAHDVLASNIVKYDGDAWTPLGAGIDGQVYALVVYQGRLYVGGSFETAGSTSVRNLACWDGANWTDVGQGVLGRVSCLAVQGDDLIVGGQFTDAGGIAAENLARWNGLSWSSMGGCGGPEARVNALLVFETEIIVGGRFLSAGGVPVNNIARYDSSSWYGLGQGITGENAEVFALASYGPDYSIYAGGSFAQAGEVPANNFAIWSGESWWAGQGLNGPVRSFALSYSEYGMPLIIAAGQFTNSFGSFAIALGDGFSWYIGGVPGTGETLAFWGEDLYASATTRFGHRLYRALQLDYPSWWIGEDYGMNGRVESFTVWNGKLIGAGQFQLRSDPPLTHIGSFAGGSISDSYYDDITGVPENPFPFVLAVHNNELIVGGQFTGVSGVVAKNIARFTGSQWASLGSGLDGAVTALAVYNYALYAATVTTDGSHVGRLSRWGTTAWTTLLESPDLYIEDMVAYSPNALPKQLIAGGAFSSIGGVSAQNIASYNGSIWSPLGTGIGGGRVEALAASGSNLIVGGEFTAAGDAPAQNIARWNGTAWSSLGSGCDGPVFALAFHEGKVMVGGLFAIAGGQPARNIALCKISAFPPIPPAWESLGQGVDGRVRCLASYNDDLALGGDFLMAENRVSAYYARWGPIIPEITAYGPVNTSTCGAPVQMSISADHAITYQWRRGTVPLADSGHFSGTTTATLTIHPVSPEDVGSDYNCVISNECGAVTSGNFKFSLYTAHLADFDGNCRVDGADVGIFSSCASGPNLPVTLDCHPEDLDNDGDADQSDFGILQLYLQ